MKKTSILILCIMVVLSGRILGQSEISVGKDMNTLIFVTYAGSAEQLQNVYYLAKSVRDFGGRYKEAPIWIYSSAEMIGQNQESVKRLESLNAEVKPLTIPEKAGWFFLSGMVFTAAAAETEAKNIAANIVMMGSDTIVLQEPDEFVLPDGKNLGYCTVMHKNISPLYSEPLDDYWTRAYTNMKISEADLFSMVTPADGDTIRPYFNAGSIVVRPEKGIFGKWAENYALLYNDSMIVKYAEADTYKRIFTFQVALIGAILNNLDHSEMVELSDKINYPIFFKEMYGAKRDFHDITEITTMRCEDFFLNPIPNWEKQLKGPADRIAWIKNNLDKQ